MIRSLHRQASLFYVAFRHQADLIKDDLLDPVDALLDDPALLAPVCTALASRRPRSSETGRKTVAPDQLLRACALKHLKGWSFRDLEREIRSSLVYRRFTRFDHQAVPDFSTFSRLFALLGDDVAEAIHARVVAVARSRRVAPGQKLRTDTTVVETNVHYPTDSSLLADGIRVLTRALERLAAECRPGALFVENHAQATKRRVLEINRAAKSRTETGRKRMRSSYQRLLVVAQKVLRRADDACDRLSRRRLVVRGNVTRALVAEGQLRHFAPLLRRVIDQTRARVLGGDVHHPDKLLSLFEEHTQAICKGKAHRPTEFGRGVRIDEVENGVVANFSVEATDPYDDRKQWAPALRAHIARYGRPPRLAAGDRGFFTAQNQRLAEELGVERVALPGRGRLSDGRTERQRQRWFRRGLRWRAGIEGRIGTLKHRFGLARATYKGEHGFKRYVAWGIITHNLVAVARVECRRRLNALARKG